MKDAPMWGASAVFLALSLTLIATPVDAQENVISPARQAELIHLLVQDCGSCHGLTMEGGLGPPLLPSDMAAKPSAWLRQVILDGIPGTAMPPWRPFLTEAEVDWLVTILQQGIPDGR